MPEIRRRGLYTHEPHRHGLRVEGGSTAVVPKELPEMYQVGFILTKLAASMVNIAIFAASMAS